MSTMTKDPMRTTEKRDDIISSGPKHYARLVTSPASRFFWLTALGWCGSLTGLVAIIAWVVWLKDLPNYPVTTEVVAVPLAVAVVFGLAAAGFLSADELLRLHDDYMETPDRTTTILQNEHGILSEGRGIQVQGVPNAIVVRRDPKQLHGVIFQSIWLERMDALIADEDFKFSRDKLGISGSKFAEVRAALLKAGYISEQSEYTAEGIEWIQTK